jgi:hypothetical protein
VLDPLNLLESDYKTKNPPIRLSYHYGNHYNSVRDPNCPTAGVGLGFSDLIPGVRIVFIHFHTFTHSYFYSYSHSEMIGLIVEKI